MDRPAVRAMTPQQEAEVLQYWFVTLKPEQWFVEVGDVDQTIRARFLSLYQRVFESRTELKPKAALEALALILVLDQFPRNLFRGTPQAFATDADALRLSQDAISQSLDIELTDHQRQFLYMPFQHSEDAGVQAQS
ncbi:MAG: DUF924 domain-containing protein, partial [Alphaproteobacteria bacterium]|nr:DUF924 domain-containing protein [Alphaproteobacteria bacterium]